MSDPFSRRRLSGVLVLVLLVAVGAVFVYWRTGVERVPGDYEARKGNYRLEDGRYEEAAREFRLALERNPDHVWANHGLAVAHLQAGRLEEAVAQFDRALEIDPGFALAYADRGIARDRIGEHEAALADYRRALELDPALGEGPGWLWRFLRNVSEKPPSIRDRAEYLEAELRKPPGERLLLVPEQDGRQRMYKK